MSEISPTRARRRAVVLGAWCGLGGIAVAAALHHYLPGVFPGSSETSASSLDDLAFVAGASVATIAAGWLAAHRRPLKEGFRHGRRAVLAATLVLLGAYLGSVPGVLSYLAPGNEDGPGAVLMVAFVALVLPVTAGLGAALVADELTGTRGVVGARVQ
jgi:hypothetical protein